MAHPDCDLFDADFRLSGQSDGILDALDLADGGRLSLGSRGSDGMDLDSLFDDDVVPEGEDDEGMEETRLPSFDCAPPPGEGPSFQGERERGRFRIDAVDFDPPAQRQEAGRADPPSALPAPTPSTSMPPADEPQPQGARSQQKQQDPEATYGRAQRNLVRAMRRSEVTRRHVIAQRDMLAPEQQKMLYLAKERLNGQAALRRMQQQTQQQTQPLSPQQQQQQDQQRRSGMMASFFRNGTLTSGLEQSRRMLGAYVGRVDRGAL